MHDLFTYLTSHSIRDLISSLVWIFGICGIAVDLTPWIRINPVRWLFTQLGKLLNGELYKRFDKLENDIYQLKEEVKQNRNDLDQNRIKDLRSRILDFSNSLAKRERDLEEFEEIFDIDLEYIELLEKNQMKNGRTSRAIENIRRYYDRLIQTENCGKVSS